MIYLTLFVNYFETYPWHIELCWLENRRLVGQTVKIFNVYIEYTMEPRCHGSDQFE